ncbi:acyl-CoA dehydrogenase family protein [Actinomadura parmotrematis]|uniref:Acyl-CoA dehydrogenase family protein n=1 Tax=Actinomadura parmotrematis TaxID=2864039 RepID=A0ABS7FQG5_9ACTN|nr:acyl-CoA dehydrogenase family protein [Actinomadura parmotrematis]MBW8482629.1 acyl-CoA dehydrogenase family protein [Actinomadura parmotrematis]
MWDFSTDPDFQGKLDWADRFVRAEIEPIDLLSPGTADPYRRDGAVYREIVRPLQEQVREQGLWAAHLPPSLGGMGMGQVRLALLNEILGRSMWAPMVFGTQAPDSGNAEILAHYGTEAQRREFLEPLLDGRIVSTFAMTEPTGGADPGGFTCRAVQEDGGWVLDGEKWFASNYPHAAFVIAMAITDPDVPVHRGSSMFIVPKGTPGMEMMRATGLAGEPVGEGVHGYLRFTGCRVPAENLLGEPGTGFVIAQTRLGGGRLHHAMRAVGQCRRALEMMTERIASRRTRGGPLADQQAVRQSLADVWIRLEQFRLQVLHAAWQADRAAETGGRDEARAARLHISAVKAATPATLVDVVYRAVHAHGALGVSNELPLARMWQAGPVLGIADGPTESHKDVVARILLQDAVPADDRLFGSEHVPTRLEAARKKYAGILPALEGDR